MNTIADLDLPTGRGAKYLALSEGIRAAVADGRLGSGSRLPTVRELAHRLGVTPGTVARAYQRLTEAGILDAQVGRGTFVARLHPAPAIAAAPGDAGVLDLLRPRLPDLGQAEIIRRALRRAAEAPVGDLLDYPGREAGLALRAALMRDMGRMDLGPVTAEDLVLTHGAQHAYVLVLQTVLRGPAPAVAVETLAYPGFRHGAKLVRAEVVTVEADAEGPVPASLAAACDRARVQVFATSSHAQNPTTVKTSLARRREIAALARARDFQIVEDECYRRTSEEMPTYRALAPERVWYLGSISKSFLAAFRIGFAIAPEGRLAEARLTARHNSFGLPYPIVAAAAEIIGAPEFPRVRDAVAAAMAARMRMMAAALSGFALTWREDVPFALLRLPPGWRTSGFVRAAGDRGVLVRPVEDFVLVDGHAPNAVRIAADGRVPEARFAEGLATLRALLADPPHEMDV